MREGQIVKLDGLKELDRKLAKMPTKLGFKALRSGMMAATRPMFLTAKANAEATGIRNRDAGATAAAMGRWTRKLTPTKTVLFIGPKNKNKKALTLYNEKHGSNIGRLKHFHLVEFGSVNGPAQPFLRPAFAAHVQSTATRLGAEIKKAIDKVVKANA